MNRQLCGLRSSPTLFITDAVQKVMDKIGNADSGNENTDSLNNNILHRQNDPVFIKYRVIFFVKNFMRSNY